MKRSLLLHLFDFEKSEGFFAITKSKFTASARKSEVKKIIDICKQTSCTVKILPSVRDLVNGMISVQVIRDVDVEDLLGRDPVEVDLRGIADYE